MHEINQKIISWTWKSQKALNLSIISFLVVEVGQRNQST